MNFHSCVYLVLTLGFFNRVRTQEVCDLDDEDCTTRAAKKYYDILVAGIKGVIEPIDPLFVKNISGMSESMKLTNAVLLGMKSCEYTHLKINSKDTTFQIDLYCPHLAIKYNYIAIGSVGPANVDSEGTMTIAIDEYDIVIKGKYEQRISDKDQKSHFYIDSYTVKTHLKGKLTLEHETLVRRNNDQSDQATAFINENYKALEESFLNPKMEKFMEVFMSRIKTFLEHFPAEQVFPK